MKCLDCGYNITSDEVGEHEGHEIVEGFFEEIDMSELLTIISNKIYSEFLSPNLVDHPMDVMNVPFNLERADRVAKEILAKFKGWNTVVVRSKAGAELMEIAKKKGVVETQPIPAESVENLKRASLNKKKRALSSIIAKTGDKKDLLYLGIPSGLADKLLAQ